MRQLLRLMLPAILLLPLLLSFTACGPGRMTDTPIPPMREINAMVELVEIEVGELTLEQRRGVREAITDNAEMKERIRQQYRGRPRELQEAEKNRLKKLDRQLQGLLTPEQTEKWKPLFRDIYNRELDGLTGGSVPQNNRRQDNPYQGY